MNYDLVFHVDTDDDFSMKLALSEAGNYRNISVRGDRKVDPEDLLALGTASIAEMPVPFKIIFVINGPAVKLVTKANKELMEKASAAHDQGVQFMIGEYAMANYGISMDDIWDFAETTPSATLKIVQLQHQGFSYIKP